MASVYMSIKEFTFSDKREGSMNDDDCRRGGGCSADDGDDNHQQMLKISIPEIAEESYGLYVWPCARVLAQHVWQSRGLIKGKNVLELGAGTALPGLVAAKCGANVTLSDCGQFEKCLEHCRHSATLNDLPDIPVMGITWGLPSLEVLNLSNLDIILASDCFYNTKDFEDIVMTMSLLLHQNPKAEVWCSYQVRNVDRSIEYFLKKWDMQGQQIPTPSTDSVISSMPDHTNHEIQLFVLTLKTVDSTTSDAVT